jgi:hypothetical protein
VAGAATATVTNPAMIDPTRSFRIAFAAMSDSSLAVIAANAAPGSHAIARERQAYTAPEVTN